jgi:hypothetical protein
MSIDKVFTKFRDPVNSYPLGEMTLGMAKPGRYSGFDVLEERTGLEIKINHGGLLKKSSVSESDIVTEITFGCLLTPNGSVIHNENNGVDNGVDLTIDHNIGNANIRYDLVVCEHEYIQVVGGQPPSYFIQKGNNLGDVPVLANPEKQIVIGVISITGEGYQFTDLSYIKSAIPLPGDSDISDYLTALGIPHASESQRGIIELLTEAEALDNPSDVNDADHVRALTLRMLLKRTATSIRTGVSRLATLTKLSLGTDTTDTVTSADLRRWSGVAKKTQVSANFSITNTADTGTATSYNNYNGLLLTAKGDPDLLEITLNKLNIAEFSLGIIGETRRVKIIAGTDVVLNTPTGYGPETLEIGEGLLIESDGTTNSGIFNIIGGLKPTP